MSKKSRRRNKRLLALAGLAGAVALSSKRKRDASIADNEAKESGFDIPAVTSTPKKKPSTPVSTKTTIMDSMPARPKKIHYQKELKKIQMKSIQLRVVTLVKEMKKVFL